MAHLASTKRPREQVFRRRNPPRRLRLCRAAARLMVIATMAYVGVLALGVTGSPERLPGRPVRFSSPAVSPAGQR